MRRARAVRSNRGGSSRSRQSKPREEQDDDLPEVYREMLAEEEARNPDVQETERPIKRRRVRGRGNGRSSISASQQQALTLESRDRGGRKVQTVVDDPASEESDMEWEEVDLQQSVQVAPVTGADDESVQVTLDDHKQMRKAISRQKPLSAAEKKVRLDIHKVHLLCLLRHVQIRNLWCNDEELQSFLKQMLSKHMISLLNPPEDKPQYTRSTTFVEGLNQACDAFNRRFRVTTPGLKRAHWADNPAYINQKAESIMTNAEVFLSKEDFRKQAKTMQGSRDFGAQLFCALLRSAAVEARLVCSLQPLPFSGATKSMAANKPDPQYIVISSDDHESSANDQQMPSASSTPRARRLGRPQFASPRASPRSRKASTPAPRSSIRDSPYPVFWVEAFNEAIQKWIPVDPLVTKSIAKPSKFEPPFSDQSNCMSYVVGFEEDASARDVTRRYVKAFIAKTRKLRVESTKDGEQWWARTMQFYERPFFETRDQLEIGELTAIIAAEPMPRNVQDFKDHPIYALERQLRQNEVIFPKRVIGQVSLGKSGSKDQVLEPVYRRNDVHVVRSADKWYRLGRDVKLGEQPLKRIPASRNRAFGFSEDEDGNESAAEVPLYAHFQTEEYKPPPVVKGKVPKNAYGNLDIYVPSMVPPGGVHIKHSDAAHAARILGIDYAEAVIGFDFKGRHGTAIFQGVVVASEYREALEEVLKNLEDERKQAEFEEQSAEMLRVWKHLLLRLRIAERVKGYAMEGEGDADGEESSGESAGSDEESEAAAGGFFPEPEQKPASPSGPSYQGLTGQNQNQGKASGGGFIPDEHTSHTRPIASSAPIHSTFTPRKRSLYSLVVVPKDQAGGASVSTSQLQPKESAGSVEPSATEVENAKSLGQVFEGSFEAPITVDSSAAGDSKSASVEILSRAPSQTPKELDEESETEYSGSLLSEDPEDEDAIPEWLL